MSSANFRDIARDLLTLEINTILKESMSAQKMPEPEDALIDIVQEYHEFLCERAQEFAPLGTDLAAGLKKISDGFCWGWEPFPRRKSEGRPAREGAPAPRADTYAYLVRPPQTVSREDWDRIREIASWLREMRDRVRRVARGGGAGIDLNDREREDAIEAHGQFRSEEHDAVLLRVQRNSDQLKRVADLLAPEGELTRRRSDAETASLNDRLSSHDLVILRKAWEVGTEIVVMQTVVQIDGDVFTRLQPGRASAADATLHALHGGAVSVAIEHWRYLADLVGHVAGAALRRLFG